MKKSLLFISCEEAYHICDKVQYEEATGWEKIKLSIRLSWCKLSQQYAKKNSNLTEAINTSNLDCLETEEKKRIKDQFEKELSNLNN